MENTRRVGTIARVGTTAGRAAVYIIMAFLMGRVAFLDGCFPAAVAFIAFMVSKNTMNIYLMVPAGLAVVLNIMAGGDGIGDLIAMAACGLLFVITRNVKTRLWQKALLSGSVYIICVSVFRIASKTVYRVEPGDLLFQGLMVMCFIYIFQQFFSIIRRQNTGNFQELAIASITTVCLTAACGAGFDFFIWPLIILIGLWATIYAGAGQGAVSVVTAAAYAALIGQGQWGVGITVLTGLVAASFARRYGKLLSVCIFTAVCFFLGKVESGVVLGVENMCLFPAVAIFLAAAWRFDEKFKAAAGAFSGEGNEPAAGGEILEGLLNARAQEMGQLANMYATYLDSRSVLSSQFFIMEQIMGDLKQKVRDTRAKIGRTAAEKYQIDIAISQCAARGTINGDSCGWQDIGDGRVAMIISDGMGKGKRAATESLMVTRTILAFLRSGVSVDLTLKMINTIMLSKDEDDAFATVDLVIVNKGSGKAKFYKIGAAPTLLRRKSNIEEVKLSAVPLGIVNGLRVNYVEVTLRKGDWIIMMSDGISDGGDRKGFLNEIKDTAVNIRSVSPQTMCDLILNRASDSYIGKERDDLTVLTARVD